MAIYAVSDLHGQYDVFMEGLKKIGFCDSDQLYVIGDAIDRGDDGIKILQYIQVHKNIELLIGNHEFLMLNSIDPNGEKAVALVMAKTKVRYENSGGRWKDLLSYSFVL